jgi:ribosomal 50S subunit-recycling heat shock protein
MRLDLYLKASRLCPRRTVAQQLCEAGFVLLNGHPARSSHHVKAGDEIALRWRGRLLVARVVAVPGARNISRQEGAGLAEIISDTPLDQEEQFQ